MKIRIRAIWFAALVLAGGVCLIIHEVSRNRSRKTLENKRTELTNALNHLHVHLDEERLNWYYAFREVEEVDERAWELAVRKVDSEITAKSNALTRVNADLKHIQSSRLN